MHPEKKGDVLKFMKSMENKIPGQISVYKQQY